MARHGETVQTEQNAATGRAGEGEGRVLGAGGDIEGPLFSTELDALTLHCASAGEQGAGWAW